MENAPSVRISTSAFQCFCCYSGSTVVHLTAIVYVNLDYIVLVHVSVPSFYFWREAVLSNGINAYFWIICYSLFKR